MNKLIWIAFNLFVLRLAISAPADTLITTSKDNKMVPLPDIARSADDKVNASKSAGTPEDLDHSRTHSPHALLLQKIEDLTRKLKGFDLVPPSVGVPIASAQASIVPSPYTWPSYGSYGYGFAPAPIQSIPVSTIPSAPVVAPVPIKNPLISHVVPTPVAISKPTISVNSPSVQQPVYPIISQQVIHKPIYTEIVEVVRRPVLSVAEEVIHKPVVTELQQVVKKPLFTQHVIKPGIYDKIQQEVYQPPLRVPGESIHVIDKPVSQVVNLPTKVVQAPIAHQPFVPTTTYPIPASIIPSKPFTTPVSSPVGFSPIFGLGSSYGSGYGSGSGSIFGYGPSVSYGYPPNAYGPSYGSGQLGISSSHGGAEYQYLTPAPICRATGTCPRDAESDKTSTSSAAVPSATPYSWTQYNPLSMTPMNYNSQMIPMNYYMQTPYSHLFDAESVDLDKPSQSDLSDQTIAENKQSLSTSTVSKSSESIDIPNMEDFLKQDTIASEAFAQIQRRYNQVKEEAKNKKKQKPESFDIQESLKQAAHLAKVNPSKWTELFKKDVVPEIQSLPSVPSGDQGKKPSS